MLTRFRSAFLYGAIIILTLAGIVWLLNQQPTNSEVEVNPEVETNSEVEADLEVEVNPEVETNSEVEADLEVEVNPEVETNSEVEADLEVEVNPEVRTNPRISGEPGSRVITDTVITDTFIAEFNIHVLQDVLQGVAPALADFDNDGDLDIVMLERRDDFEADWLVLKIFHNDHTDFSLAQSVRLTLDVPYLCYCEIVSLTDLNQDGFVDVLVALPSAALLLLNDNGQLAETPVWRSPDELNDINGAAWGDYDDDGDDDLALSNEQGVWLYETIDGVLSNTPVWKTQQRSEVTEWVDVNNDGWLDLVGIKPVSLFLNERGTLTQNSVWQINHPLDEWDERFGLTQSLVVEDFDGNGLLDFALFETFKERGNSLQLFSNEDGLPSTTDEFKQSLEPVGGMTTMYAADIENDGYFDLLFASLGNMFVLYNDDPDEVVFETEATAFSPHTPGATQAAFGDLDNNNTIDFVTDGSNPTVYIHKRINYVPFTADYQPEMCLPLLADRNEQARLENPLGTQFPTFEPITWADVDNDALQDIFLFDVSTGQFQLHLGEHKDVVDKTPAWQWHMPNMVRLSDYSLDDIDGDGDLDATFAVRNEVGHIVFVFENVEGRLNQTPRWQFEGSEVAWGDIDSDGALDLVVIKPAEAARLYLVEDGELVRSNWATDLDTLHSPRWFDVDSDGDLDLVMLDSFSGAAAMSVNLNHNGTLSEAADWRAGHVSYLDAGIEEFDLNSYIFKDVDQDGLIDIVTMPCSNSVMIYFQYGISLPRLQGGITLQIDDFDLGSQTLYSDIVPIPYTLTHAGGQPFRSVRAFYSVDGGRDWQIAVPTAETMTTDLQLNGTSETYTFYWDIQASSFFGRSDNVIVRLEALPAHKSSMKQGGVTSMMGLVGGQTPPLRVEGLHVRVMQEDQFVDGALVYRLPANSTEIVASPLTDDDSQLLQTLPNGRLDRRAKIQIRDQLVALNPVSVTHAYTLYHTSATPTVAGVTMHSVDGLGIQELAVSAENPLMLFNFDISLEWDARNDFEYLSQLQSDIQRASEVLFDLTNGQAALGDVHIYHAKEHWQTADIVILANNQHRPNANLGGIVTQPMSDTLRSGDVIPDAFTPGQIRMGANWNRYGEPSGTIGEDWPRVLAHEIGHYAFFLLDNYLGRDPQTGFLTLADCQGSVMTDSYRQDYSEFLSRTANSNRYVWGRSCANTLAQQTTGRSDWETIRAFYPFLKESMETIDGPRTLPLAVTQITIMPHEGERDPLDDEFFYLLDNRGDAFPVADANAYLIQTQGTLEQTDDHIVPLGSPIGPLVQARGVMQMDKVCVYTDDEAGCVSVQTGDRRLTLQPTRGWKPNIEIRPTSDNTLLITATVNVEAVLEQLSVQIYPYAASPTETVRAPIVRLEPQGDGVYSAEFEPSFPIFSGHARVWSNANRTREKIVRFAWTPGWDGYNFTGWGGYNFTGWGGYNFTGWGVNLSNSWQAPVSSSDGQVTILNLDDLFTNRRAIIMQSVSNVALPSWLTPVGDVYRYLDDGTDDATIAIQFRYLERSLPIIEQEQLAVYFQPEGEQTWQPLPTLVDTTRNAAFANLAGNGLYALIATIELPAFETGTNIFSYPLIDSRPIEDALASIASDYVLVEQINPNTGEPFETLPTELAFGQLYRIEVVQPTTLYLAPSKE